MCSTEQGCKHSMSSMQIKGVFQLDESLEKGVEAVCLLLGEQRQPELEGGAYECRMSKQDSFRSDVIGSILHWNTGMCESN